MQRRASTQDITWFLDLNANGQLNLDPPYQRRSVWTPKDRKFFLDTIFRGYPCPSIFINKIVDPDTQKATYEVVDGKQRLQTILMFSEDKIAIADDFGDSRFNGKKRSQLSETERNLFWDYILPVEFLSFSADDTHSVNLAFERMNRNSRKLEPQELRHARWDGWFISKVEGECEDPIWKSLGIVTSARSRRMKDAQFISELLLVLIEKKQHGFDQEFLNASYAKYDDIEVEDTETNFDEESFEAELGAAKANLQGLNELSGVVRKCAGTLQLFYTIWAALILHPAGFEHRSTANEKLEEMLRRLNELKTGSVPDLLLAQPERYAQIFEVSEALQGATTDLVAREKRLGALVRFLEAQ